MAGAAVIRDLRTDDFAAVAALLRKVRGDNLYTERGVRYAVESEPARADAARWVAEQDGVVGYGVAMRIWWRAANEAYGWVGVVPEARRRGLGHSLWERVGRHVEELGADLLLSDVVGDDPGEALLRADGFLLERLDRVSVLDPRAVDLDDLQERERRFAADGYGLRTLASIDDPRALYELAREVAGDMPGTTAYAITFADWEAGLRAPDLDPDASAVVTYGGRPVSLALLSVDLDSRRARNEDTGTARAHRRRGLATLAKLATIRWAREHGIEAILTDNAEQNVGMLAINERLGYRPLLARSRWVKTLR